MRTPAQRNTRSQPPRPPLLDEGCDKPGHTSFVRLTTYMDRLIPLRRILRERSVSGLARGGTNWLNLRFVTPLDIALRMGAPFLVERGHRSI